MDTSVSLVGYQIGVHFFQPTSFMWKKVLFVLALVCVVAGCGHHTGGLAPSSEPLAPGSYTELGPVQGEDCVYHFLGLIPLSNGNETKDAVANALSKAPGATALVKVTADTYAQHFIIFSRVCTQVDGTAVAVK
jgi:hypothetical protein